MKTVLFQTIFLLFGILLLFSKNLDAGTGSETKVYGIAYHRIYNYEGSPYIDENWLDGRITLYNGQISDVHLLKYNLLTDELIFFHPDHQRMYLADRNSVKGFSLFSPASDTLYFERYQGLPSGFKLTSDSYVQSLYQGTIRLFVRHQAKVDKANRLNERNRVYAENYYFIMIENRPNEVRLKLRSVLRLFPEIKQEIRRKSNLMSFRNNSEEDMITLVEWIDQQLLNR